MASRPQTLIVRLWRREDGVMVELRPLQTQITQTFTSLEALIEALRERMAKEEADESD